MDICAFVRASALSYGSDRLYLEGGSAGVTCEDVVNKKTLPQALQEELLRSRGQDVVSAKSGGTQPTRADGVGFLGMCSLVAVAG